MTESLLSEIVERGYHLAYLRGPNPWEASIRRRLPDQTPSGYIYAVGYGVGPLPTIALSEALDAVENDFSRLDPTTLEYSTLQNPGFDLSSSQPASISIAAILANLRPPPAPVFLRKL